MPLKNERERVDAILDAAGKIAGRADEFDKVLAICQKKAGGLYWVDNDLTVAEAVFLMESLKHWLMTCMQEGR
jgi:hypothetical protein